MEEMQSAKTNYFELKGQKKDMYRKIEAMDSKNKLLRNLIGF